MTFQPSGYVWPFNVTDGGLWSSVGVVPVASVDDLPLTPVNMGIASNIIAVAIESDQNLAWYRGGWCSVGVPNLADGGLGNSPRLDVLNVPIALNRAQLIQLPDLGYTGGGGDKFYIEVSFVRWLRTATVRAWQFIP